MPRFRQRGRPDSATSMRVSGSYSENDGQDHSSEAARTPPSSDEHPSLSHTSRTVAQVVEEVNICIASLEAFPHDDPCYGQITERLSFLKDEYHQKVNGCDRDISRARDGAAKFIQKYLDRDENYDEVSEAGNITQRSRRPFHHIGSVDMPLVGAVSPFGNTRFPTKALDQIPGGMFSSYREFRMPRSCHLETQSSPRTDDVAHPLVEDSIAPSADKDHDQDAEQPARKRWSTVKVKTASKKSNTAYADCSDSSIEDCNSYFQFSAPASVAEEREVEERVSPKLQSFEEVHCQLRQELLPPYKFSPRDQSWPTVPYMYSPQYQNWSTVPHWGLPNEYFDYSPPSTCLKHGWLLCTTCTAFDRGDVTTAAPANSARDPKPQDAPSGVSTVKVHNFDSPLLKENTNIIDRPLRSDTSHTDINTESTVGKDRVMISESPARKQDESTTAVVEDKKQAIKNTDRPQERSRVVHEDLSKSDSEIVPVISKSRHPTKASDVKTATGFASPHKHAAPDDSMVEEFLEVADYKFTREESFEILRMCGANLVAAVSMYHNAMGPEHLRQMLRAWLAPLENAEFRTAARFYTENVDNQGRPWGVPSEKEVGIEEEERQPSLTIMNVRDAFTLLGLSEYNSVDFDTLQAQFQDHLHWPQSSAYEQQLQQAYDTIFQHQNNEDCWVSWTKAMDETLMGWKTENTKTWTSIGAQLGVPASRCKDRFRNIQPLNWEPNPPQKSKPKNKPKNRQQQQGAKIQASTTQLSAVSPKVDSWGFPLRPRSNGFDIGRAHSDASDDYQQSLASYKPDANIWEDTDEPVCNFNGLNSGKASESVPTAYTVTYWATVESGDKMIHTPVDSSNFSGPEKAIIEGSAGLKKVWKWIQEKGLSDKVSLQDAFDLAKDMHGKNEDDESVIEEPESMKDVSRPTTCSFW